MQPQLGLTPGQWWWRLEPSAAVGTPGGDTCPRRCHSLSCAGRGALGTLRSAMSFSTALGVFSVISGLVCYLVTSLSGGTCATHQGPRRRVLSPIASLRGTPASAQLTLNARKIILIPA